MAISIELVPRSREQLTAECQRLVAQYPELDTINIPDLLRMPLRSWEACEIVRRYFSRAIPHLRAQDFDLAEPRKLEDAIQGSSQVLVIAGDAPQNFSHLVHRTSSIDVISYLKKNHSAISVYAGFDPYRQGVKAEIEYAYRKLAAGATGLFSQPFFSLSLLEVYIDQLPAPEIYWGIAPVLSAQSRAYWEVTNQAIFQSGFEHSLNYNQVFGRRALEIIQRRKGSAYFMPIRTDVNRYLEGILR